MSKSNHIHCIRYSLVLLHILFLILGALFLTLAVWMIAVPATKHIIEISTSDITQTQILRVCYVTICIASIACVISLIGFCGTLNNQKHVFLFIGIMLIVLLITELAICIVAVFLQDRVSSGLISELSRSLSQYAGDDAADVISMGWKETQTSLSCCGINTDAGYLNHTNVVSQDESDVDVYGSLWYREIGQAQNRTWPESCCTNPLTCYTDQMESLKQEGCLPSMRNFLRNHIYLFSILSAMTLVFQIIAVILSLYMHTMTKNNQISSDKLIGT